MASKRHGCPCLCCMSLWKELGLPVKPPKERPKKPWTTKRLTVLGIAVGVASLAVAAAVLAFVLLL